MIDNYVDKLISEPQYNLTLEDMIKIFDDMYSVAYGSDYFLKDNDKAETIARITIIKQIRDYLIKIQQENEKDIDQ